MDTCPEVKIMDGNLDATEMGSWQLYEKHRWLEDPLCSKNICAGTCSCEKYMFPSSI